MKKVILPLGLPGAGKSTEVARAVHQADADVQTSAVCSTDDFFMEGGVYRFNPGKLMEFHARNFQKFVMALVDGIDLVIVDNTNLVAAHREPYIRTARALGYEVEIRVIGEFSEEACQEYAARNTHGVPLEGIRRMARSAEIPQITRLGALGSSARDFII